MRYSVSEQEHCLIRLPVSFTFRGLKRLQCHRMRYVFTAFDGRIRGPGRGGGGRKKRSFNQLKLLLHLINDGLASWSSPLDYINMSRREVFSKRRRKTFSPSHAISPLRQQKRRRKKKKKKVGRSRTKCLAAGWLTPRNILPFPYSLLTVRSSLCLLPEAARVPPRAFLPVAAAQNPGAEHSRKLFPLPGGHYSAIPVTAKAIWSDIRGLRLRDRQPVRGTVRGLPQILNYVSQCGKGSACWESLSHNSRPAPSEHCVKVVKQICPCTKSSDLENIPLCGFPFDTIVTVF